MSFNVYTSSKFDKELKKLAKKYRSLKNEFADLIVSLKENPNQGDALNHNCFKIRLAIESKGKGKSGGARVIAHVYKSGNAVYLLSIYDKSERDTISEKELVSLLQSIR